MSTLTCANCGSDNKPGALYCRECGTQIGQQGAEPRGNYCPAGRHVMDPGWSHCPYCTNVSQQPAMSPGRQQYTAVESTHAEPQPLDSSSQRPSGVTGNRPTQFMPAAEEKSQAPGGRRVVGVLVTYSWLKSGSIHPVCEGRNYIGRSEECEIRIKDDPDMSARHATIVCRDGQFTIQDETSMNGTYLGKDAVQDREKLANYASIRTGRTEWRFVQLHPQ
jgi:hypothetical protein